MDAWLRTNEKPGNADPPAPKLIYNLHNVDYSEITDEALVHVIISGEPDSVRELYRRYGRLVFSVAFYVVGEREVAEEITQEVFVQAWKNAARYRSSKGKLATWLASIARYRSIDHIRRERSRRNHRPIWPVDLEASGFAAIDDLETRVERSQDSVRIRSAVLDLPAEQQQVLTLAFFRGYSHREISEALSLPLGTVKTRIRLGMQKLRMALKELAPSLADEER